MFLPTTFQLVSPFSPYMQFSVQCVSVYLQESGQRGETVVHFLPGCCVGLCTTCSLPMPSPLTGFSQGILDLLLINSQCLHIHYSPECDLGTSSLSIYKELVRNVESQVPPQTC